MYKVHFAISLYINVVVHQGAVLSRDIRGVAGKGAGKGLVGPVIDLFPAKIPAQQPTLTRLPTYPSGRNPLQGKGFGGVTLRE